MKTETELTLADKVDQWAVTYKDNIAVKFKGESISYSEFRGRVRQLARGLIEIGVKKGDKVCVWLPNGIDWIVADYAITYMGAVLVPLNLKYTTPEIEHVFSLADISTVIMMDVYWKENAVDKIYELCPEAKDSEPGRTQSERFPELKNLICQSESTYSGMYKYSDVLAKGDKGKDDDVLDQHKSAIGVEDTAKIFFTSGTTSFPKGVVLTHKLWRNIVNLVDVMQITEKDIMANAVPTFYILGNLQQVLSSLLAGATIVPIEVMDPAVMLETIEKEKCTIFHGIPTLLMALVEHPDLEKYDVSSLRTGGMGGAPFTADLVRDVQEKLHIHEIHTGYGLTETTAVNMLTRKGDSPDMIATTIGKAVPGMEVKIIDPETGKEVPDGTVGECVIRGDVVMNEYYKRPEETAKVIRDGWFHTEDLLMRREDGYYEFAGRIKDIIRRGGENISVSEVESVVGEHPKVAQAELIGLPDPRYEEVGMLFVRLQQDESCTEEEIREFCRERLAKYKVPQYVQFISEFPLTATGKVQKYVLKEMAIKEMA
jgi:fatty-acyl-CoA synthase